MLTSFSKLFLKVIHSQLYDHLQENDILRPEQFGFRPNYSTELACINLTDHILKQMDNMQMPLKLHIFSFDDDI